MKKSLLRDLSQKLKRWLASRKEGSRMTKEYILDFLRQNKQLLKERYNVSKIGLFGSYAQGTPNENSDIDILVDMPSSFDNFFELKYFLEDAFGKTVDLGKTKNVRLLIKKYIDKEIIYV